LSEKDPRARLAECLSPPFYTCVFSDDLVSLEAVGKAIIERGLQVLVGAVRATFYDNKHAIGIVYLREERCWRDCDERCGSRETPCFPRCFYDCMNDAYLQIKRALEEGP